MKLRINASSLPRIQTFAMVAVVLVSVISVSGLILFKSYLGNAKQLANLRQGITDQQYNLLRSEVSTSLQYIEHMQSQADQLLRERVQSHVNQAYETTRSIYLHESGKQPVDEVKQLIKEALRQVRFSEGRGYIFIQSYQGISELLPTVPKLEGRDMSANTDDVGELILPKFIAASDNAQRAGFASYRWYPPEQRKMAEKISYIRRFEPFEWFIGAGDYLFQIEADLKRTVLEQLALRRFGQNGYFAVIDTEGKTLSNPSAPHLDGKSLAQLPVDARAAVTSILTVAEKGGGFSEYDWRLPSTGRLTRKISLIQPVDGWDWILIAGVYPEDIDLLLSQQAEQLEDSVAYSTRYLLLAATAACVLALLVAWLLSRWLKQIFQQYQADINANQRELQIASDVFEAASEGMMVTDSDNNIIAANAALEHITGYSKQDVLGKNPNFLSSGIHSEDFYQQMWQQLESYGRWQGEIWNRRKDGLLFPEWLSISVKRDATGKISNYIASIADISDRKQTEERLRYLAEYDTLTDLPNRSLLKDRALQALAQAQTEQQMLALVHIDLDRFKNVNDSLGHAAGDRVLQETSRRMLAQVRPGDTIARLGGDGFAVLITEVDSISMVETFVRQLVSVIAEPMRIEGESLILTPSAGIAMYPVDGEDFNSLLRKADTALYHVKEQGRNHFQFYKSDMNSQVSERLSLEVDLWQALAQSQFELHYQPQYCLGEAQPKGVEALIRWHHPKQGLLRPDGFIPLAEEVGLILPIGSWVLHTACQQAASWDKAPLNQLTVAVNVSAYQFHEELVDDVRSALKASGLAPERLVLELTETALMDDIEQSACILAEIKTLGVKIALDDFGTGYSSLSYLKRFPLDKLKIDRAFTLGLPNDTDDKALTASIIDIARNMNLDTIAEGIETKAQQQFLQQAGCDQGQGYLYSRPVSAEDLQALLCDRDIHITEV